jgi:ribosomal protein L29
MKKSSSALAKIQSTDLAKEVVSTRASINELKLGVKLGNTQNYKLIGAKKKSLARIMGRINEEERNKK